MLVNCLLNVFAICVGEVNVFSLKAMGTRLYFVILLKNVEKIFDWH